MEKIFENAYFGKKFKTRDGRLALFLSIEHCGHADDKYNPPFVIVYCAVEHHIKYTDGSEKFFHEVCHYNEYGKWNKWNPNDDDLDIIGLWEEQTDKIRLSAEILEKNDWECIEDEPKYSWWAWRHKSLLLYMDFYGDSAEIEICGRTIEIKYVDELLQVYKTCGLDEMAKNFKIN